MSEVGKLYKLKPSTIKAELVDVLLPDTGEIVWPVNTYNHPTEQARWHMLEDAPLLLVKKELRGAPLQVVGKLPEELMTEFFFLFHETMVTVICRKGKDFAEHFYEAS